MLISGALAGMLSLNEILGVHHKIVAGFPAGYGFTGIAVALMGRNHPIGILPAAFLFGIFSWRFPRWRWISCGRFFGGAD